MQAPATRKREVVYAEPRALMSSLREEIDREEILSGLKRLEPWFHCIELGHGLRTKTRSIVGEQIDHPLSTWQLIRRALPQELTGKSLLDVGCNAGFYAVEAKRLGAGHVVGVDARRFHIRQARFVRRVLGLDIDFRRQSVYDLKSQAIGQFDITLALGLVYHCKHLVLALENLYHVTKETLILETAIYPPERLPDSFSHSVGGQVVNLHALAYVENPLEAQEAAYNWFLPGAESLRALLQSVGFERVQLFACEGERAIFVCRKQNAYADSRALDHLAAKLTMERGVTLCHPRQDLYFSIRAENTGYARWLAFGEEGTAKGAVRLGTHLLAQDEEELVWEYGRAELTEDLAPGETLRLDIHLRAPLNPGRYYIEFDMVVEHLAWFEDLGSPIIRHELMVEPHP